MVNHQQETETGLARDFRSPTACASIRQRYKAIRTNHAPVMPQYCKALGNLWALMHTKVRWAGARPRCAYDTCRGVSSLIYLSGRAAARHRHVAASARQVDVRLGEIRTQLSQLHTRPSTARQHQ